MIMSENFRVLHLSIVQDERYIVSEVLTNETRHIRAFDISSHLAWRGIKTSNKGLKLKKKMFSIS